MILLKVIRWLSCYRAVNRLFTVIRVVPKVNWFIINRHLQKIVIQPENRHTLFLAGVISLYTFTIRKG